MTQPILSLTPANPEEIQKATPNLLPCKIHHNGSIEPVESFWEPTQAEDGSRAAYFRGRKLQGKALKLPEGYRGVVAAPIKPEPKEEDADVVDLTNDGRSEQGNLNVQAEFDEVVVWDHETTSDASADPYVRGMEEWLSLAEQIHGYEVPEKK
ncbi:hypothetical protein OQA88_2195 [Cercophora sp. LCS_1]